MRHKKLSSQLALTPLDDGISSCAYKVVIGRMNYVQVYDSAGSDITGTVTTVSCAREETLAKARRIDQSQAARLRAK